MPPWARLSRHTSPMAAENLEFSEWERSKISNQDVNLLKKLGLAKTNETLIFPSEESFPTPRIGYRLHQLTPSSILHISIFITLCECFLGTPPNWGLWKRIFLVHRNSSHNIAYNVGGVVICVRPDVEYFDVKFSDSVQGWRKRWLYIREEHIDSQDYNIAPFADALAKANKRANDLAVKLEQSEKAREKAEQDSASVGELRKRLHQAETALSANTTQQIDREEDVIGRLESQNLCFVRKMVQDFELERPEGDRLLDTLSLLEIHGDLARRSIADARTAFTRLFPYFFPKKSAPEPFSELAKCYVPEEDLGLAFRQENLKIGVEGTIALVAESQQSVDWAKAGETKKINKERWQSLIKAAKPHSKKILSFLGYKPATTSSSAKPEVK
ncbi:hypothetical protein QYE76_056364 [Lolium multiflorum]|uniref:Transposase (putative) gypsy type domain-containing protein n=1 Tax=Lolium multiflorum TaxID=4521 RepID=A0AAD8T2W3_LOLMU|nr:hypothetical protein QYE76_056364 [Lolium multiflorum]